MLILEIAAGIVLGVLALVFLEQIIGLGLLLLFAVIVVACLVGLVWSLQSDPDGLVVVALFGAFFFFVAVGRRAYARAFVPWRQRRQHELEIRRPSDEK